MKKLIILSLLTGFVFSSCSKKPEHPLQDSNVMIPEPDVDASSETPSENTDSIMVEPKSASPVSKDSAAVKTK